MVSLKQLRYALAVAEHEHFKRAADACAISQSALSGAISDMESLLGFKVFERDNKRVLVTSLGQEFLERAHKIHIDVQDLHVLAEKIKAPMSGKFKLGMIPTVAPYLLPAVLPDIRKQFPDLQLIVEEDQSHALLSRLKNGVIDSAILALPYNCEGMLALPFWQEDFYIIANVNDPIAEKQSVKSEDLDLNQLLLLEDGHCLKNHALAVCQFESMGSEIEIRANSLSTLVHLVANRMGTTLAPQLALSQLLQSQSELAAIKLDEPSPHRELAFIVRPSYPEFDKLEHLKASFRAILERR